MPYAALSTAVAHVKRAVTPVPADETDGELLQRFVQSRDEAAFAELVRRLGPMVLGVCRRVAYQHADDAFQAAFVVLARRAADVRPREAVRGWLYGVAVRTAREARAVSARRLTREVAVAVVPDRAAEPNETPDADTLQILDEEIAGLPDHLRLAVVLCELDGLGRKDAAAHLGIPEGTVSSRLAKARKLLGERLRRRGIALPAALTVLAYAAVSPRLAAKTSAFATPGVAVPPAVATLTNGVFRTMFFQKLTIGAACALLLAVAGLAAIAALPGAAAKELPPSPVRLALQTRLVDEKPPAKPIGPGKIVVGRVGAYWLLDPDGKKTAELALPDKTESSAQPALSPDGKRVAFVVNEELPPMRERNEPWPLKVVVRSLEKPENEKVWDVPAWGLTVQWTADGKRIVVGKELDQDSLKMLFESVLLDPETGKTEPLCDYNVLDCGKDGKTFLVETHDPEKKRKTLGLYSTDNKQLQELTTLSGHASTFVARLSPDGKTVLLLDGDRERKDAYKWGISHRPYLLDVKTKERKPVPEFTENAQATGAAWSPDGKKIAFAWRQLHPDLLKKDTLEAGETNRDTEAFLIIADADGTNQKTVATEKGPNSFNLIWRAIDWK